MRNHFCIYRDALSSGIFVHFSSFPSSSLHSVLSLCCYNFVMFEGMCDVDFSLFHCCVSLLHNLPCFRLFSLSTILTFFYFSLCRHFIQRQLNLIYLVRCIPCVVCLWWKCCFLFPLDSAIIQATKIMVQQNMKHTHTNTKRTLKRFRKHLINRQTMCRNLMHFHNHRCGGANALYKSISQFRFMFRMY